MVKGKDSNKFSGKVYNPIESKYYEFDGKYTDNSIELNFDDIKFDINKKLTENGGVFTNNIDITVYDKDEKVLTYNEKDEFYFDKKVEFNNNDSVSIKDITQEEIDTIMTDFESTKLYEFYQYIENIVNNLDFDNEIEELIK